MATVLRGDRMKHNFYINNIDDEKQVNELSQAINSLEEVSRIKIGKDMISFTCEQPDNIEGILLRINKNLILRERVNKENRKYDFNAQKQNLFFLFTNLDAAKDAQAIEEVLSRYTMYENVHVDFQNKLLQLRTADKKVLVRLQRIVEKINPAITVELWKKPFKSHTIFADKYLKNYLRISILVIAFALGLVSRDRSPWITKIGWLLALAVICEPMIKTMRREYAQKKYFNANTAIVFASVLAWVHGSYLESFISACLYRMGEFLLSKLSTYAMNRINQRIDPPQIGRKEVNGEIFMSPLDDFDIGDILIVPAGETVSLGGTVIAGKSTLDTYSVNGSKIPQNIQSGQEVQSGSVNIQNDIKVRVHYGYQRSALSKIIDIAALSPETKSRTQKVTEYISKSISVILLVVAVVCGVLLPIINFSLYSQYLYLAAILMILAGASSYQHFVSYAILAGVASAFTKGIIIKENSGLGDLYACKTIIYDRFDGVEVNEEELELFSKLKNLHRKLIIFNDGPVALENEQYDIYNDLSTAEKEKIMDQETMRNPVAYIGDSFKDVSLLQKSNVAITRGGLHDYKVVENSDIMVTNSDYNTIIDTFTISSRQRHIVIGNMIVGIVTTIVLDLLASLFILPLWSVIIVYTLINVLLLYNTHRIIR